MQRGEREPSGEHLRSAGHDIRDYRDFIGSFVNIRDTRVRQAVDLALDEGRLWPEPWLSLNPKFKPGGTMSDLVAAGTLHPECDRIFRIKDEADSTGTDLNLYQHQVTAIETARSGDPYVLTTGTGWGKSLAYIVPIVDHVLRQGPGRGIKAIVVYPMNALANSQFGELRSSSTVATPTAEARCGSSATPARSPTRSGTPSSPTRPTSCSPTT